jgi:hypothetical protein
VAKAGVARYYKMETPMREVEFEGTEISDTTTFGKPGELREMLMMPGT